jgi:hypothetical protein
MTSKPISKSRGAVSPAKQSSVSVLLWFSIVRGWFMSFSMLVVAFRYRLVVRYFDSRKVFGVIFDVRKRFSIDEI